VGGSKEVVYRNMGEVRLWEGRGTVKLLKGVVVGEGEDLERVLVFTCGL
jgi:hypothetical protein